MELGLRTGNLLSSGRALSKCVMLAVLSPAGSVSSDGANRARGSATFCLLAVARWAVISPLLGGVFLKTRTASAASQVVVRMQG